jgi:hypothetical protein
VVKAKGGVRIDRAAIFEGGLNDECHRTRKN